MPLSSTGRGMMAQEPNNQSGCGFILLWGYLMIVAIVLAPMFAFIVKRALS
jgi:hypothetical protein